MPKLERCITLTKLTDFFFQCYSDNQLLSLKKVNKFQGPSSNSYQDILLTRKAFDKWIEEGLKRQYSSPTPSSIFVLITKFKVLAQIDMPSCSQEKHDEPGRLS